jgi:hypothetical protein
MLISMGVARPASVFKETHSLERRFIKFTIMGIGWLAGSNQAFDVPYYYYGTMIL